MKKQNAGVSEALRMAAVSHRLLTAGTVLCAAASVLASLLPPLLLARIIDGLTAGLPLTFTAVLLYFGSLALEGALLAALLLLLKNISLPGSLLPPDSVLRISHYSQEFSAIFGALAQFGQEALFALRQRASVISIAILAVGFVLPLIWCAGWMAKRKKKAEDED